MKFNAVLFRKNPSRVLFAALLPGLLLSASSVTAAFEPVVENRQPVVSEFQFDALEGFKLTVEAAPGAYGIEATDYLAGGWTLLENLILDGPSGIFTDAQALSLDRRFYRVTGDYEASDYHFLNVYLAVESGFEGRLYSGFRAFDTARLGFAGGTSASLTLFDVRMSDIFATPGEVEVAAFIESGEFGTLLADIHPDGFTAQFPSVEEGNPFDYMESRAAWELPVWALEGDRDTLAGVALSPYQITVGGNVTEGREVNLGLMGRKSRDANLEAMEGAWGIIRWLEEANDWRVLYNIGAYAFDVNAQTGEFDFSYVRETEVEQPLSGALPHVDLDFVDEAEFFSMPIAVATDGSLDLFDGDFHGFVSSSADFLAAVSLDPDLLSDLENDGSIEVPVHEGEYQYVIGVRRDTNPQLAGRSYRIMGQGVIVQPGKFEILALSPEENTLVIAADGNTATETMTLDWFAAGFGGWRDQGTDGPFDLEYDVSIDANGLIRMRGELEDEDAEFVLFGFAQEGGRVLVLAKAIAVPEEGAGDLAVVIAVEVD